MKLSVFWNFGHDWIFKFLHCDTPKRGGTFDLEKLSSKLQNLGKNFPGHLCEFQLQNFYGCEILLTAQQKSGQSQTLFSNLMQRFASSFWKPRAQVTWV